MRNFFSTALMLVVMAGLSVPAFAQPKIGYVDLQRALMQVDAGKNAKATLERKVKAKQKEMDKLQDDLKRQQDELEKQAALMKEDVRHQKAQEYQRKLMELQEYYLNNQKELAEEEGKLTQPILDRFEKILGDIATADKYTLIVEKSTTVYADPAIDLTDRLIQEFNKTGK